MSLDARERQAVTDAGEFGKVAVLYGGSSAERDISLMSGAAVLDALVRRGVDAHSVDVGNDVVEQLRGAAFSRAWNALHGRGGEDGQLQGVLEALGIACTGSGILGSAIAMDKLRTKQLLEGAGVATPVYREVRSPQELRDAAAELGLPLMIKPSDEGSSLGLARVESMSELDAAFANAAQYDCAVFAERWITGPEYSASILHGEVLPLVRIDAANTFYDYEAKYFSDDTRYVCPCGLSDAQEREFGALALRAFELVGADGWGRVDFMLDESDRPLILEVNTVPGMTSHSLVPMSARAAGIDFDELVWRILETARAH